MFFPWWLRKFWDWFWFYRHGKINIKIYPYGESSYIAWASNGKVSVWNCYGGSPEQATEMAKFRIGQALQERKTHNKI